MAKVKIIDSYSLKCLKSELLGEIEEADNQITACKDELDREKQHRQNDVTAERISVLTHDWILRRDVLHQCLCKIQGYEKELEI